MDQFLFSAINGLAGKWPLLDLPGTFLAAGLIWAMVFLFIIFIFWQKKFKLFASVFFAAVIGYAANYLISLIYFRPRPFVSMTDTVLLINKSASEASFPSDHAVLAFVIAATVFMANRKWGCFFIILASLVAIGRVFAGVHYVSDILAGAVLGSLWAFISRRLILELQLKIHR